jgi:hypothetical protein
MAVTRSGSPLTSTLDPDYVQVPVESLLPGRALPFSLYYRVDEEHILFRGAGRHLEKPERDRLLQTHLTELYISRSEEEKYRRYMDGVLREVTCAPGIDLDQKVRTFHSLATAVAAEVLRAPDTPEGIASAGNIVRGAFSFLGNGKEVLHRIMGLMAVRHELVAHSLNVTHYGLALALAAGFEEPDAVLGLGLGLLLHDVGFRMIPDRLLEKRGPLSFAERCAVRQHVQLGAQLLEGRVDGRARDVILHHHERCDGSGYPEGLTAADLPIEDRPDRHGVRPPHHPSPVAALHLVLRGDPPHGQAPLRRVRPRAPPAVHPRAREGARLAFLPDASHPPASRKPPASWSLGALDPRTPGDILGFIGLVSVP